MRHSALVVVCDRHGFMLSFETKFPLLLRYRIRLNELTVLDGSIAMDLYLNVHTLLASSNAMSSILVNVGMLWGTVVKYGESTSTTLLMVASIAPSVVRMGPFGSIDDVSTASVSWSISSCDWDSIVTNTSLWICNKKSSSKHRILFLYIFYH